MTVDGIRHVNECEKDVVEECLKCGDTSAFLDEKGGESIGACDAQGECLSIDVDQYLSYSSAE